MYARETLRIIICGSAGTGKSTLIDRLLFENKAILNNTRQHDARDDEKDLSLFVDDLQIRYRQNSAVDAACYSFSSKKRGYIVIDAPNYARYIHDVALSAFTADLAIILIDACKSIRTQIRGYSRIIALLGIRHVVLAISKMDLVNFDEAVFNAIVADFHVLTADFKFDSNQIIPLSGLNGDNVLQGGNHMAWYAGPSLMDYLDTVVMQDDHESGAFYMPVQQVNPASSGACSFSGRVVKGTVRCNDAVRILPSGVRSRISAIHVGDKGVDAALKDDAATLILSDEVDLCRGDMLVAAEFPFEVADQFKANLLWLSEHAMVPGRQYVMKLVCKEVTATITEISYREDMDTGTHLAAKTVDLNEIAVVNLSTSAPLVFERKGEDHDLRRFILVDKLTLVTMGVGIISFALRRASNIHWQALELSKLVRAEQKHQNPKCIWFTGLSGSGKSTIANLLEKKLYQDNKHTYLLDGDNVRHGLNRDLGFSEADRVENIRRVAEVAKLMVDAGLIVLVSFISPFRSERRMARELFAEGEFMEVFIDTPIEECERRDVKGLYAKARSGNLKNFTGIDSPYEPPESPEVYIQTTKLSPEACAVRILELFDRT